jgi:iron complex outermembrane receptor protein
VLQYQSIPVATQAPPSHSGGVIDLDRDYAGMNLRWRRTHEDVAGGRLDWSAGLAYDWQGETRRGYENFIGSQLGVQGRLRRDERNQARSADPYLQAEWSTQSLALSAGLRQARVRYWSEDHYIVAGNGDDSGSMAWRGWLPSLGLRLNLLPNLVAHASVGRGMETPTLNEVAYRPGGQSGLNTGLAASAHNTVEVGLRGRHGNAGWNLTLFETHTQRELTVLSNTGGRATYQNAGRTLRRGLEFSGNAQWGRLTASTALTLLQARYRDGFLTCDSTPCTTPTAPVDAGARLAGTSPRRLWSELAWQLSPQWTWTVDMLHSGPVAVNDRNTDRAAGYTVWGSSLRWSRQWQQWSALTRTGRLGKSLARASGSAAAARLPARKTRLSMVLSPCRLSSWAHDRTAGQFPIVICLHGWQTFGDHPGDPGTCTTSTRNACCHGCASSTCSSCWPCTGEAACAPRPASCI